MHSAFKTIEFGPTKTSYHRNAFNDQFKEALAEYLEKELLPQVDEPYEFTVGSVVPEFNEERYCGPNSAVRNFYRLKFAFVRSGSRDEIEALLRRDPKSGSFGLRYIRDTLFLWTQKRKEAEANLSSAIDALVERITKGKKDNLLCPMCEKPLGLIDAPGLFDLRCPLGCFNYNFHRDAETRELLHGHFFSRPRPQ